MIDSHRIPIPFKNLKRPGVKSSGEDKCYRKAKVTGIIEYSFSRVNSHCGIYLNVHKFV